MRLTLTRGIKVISAMYPRLNQSVPTLIILPEFKPPAYDKRGITLVTSSIRRSPPHCLDPRIHHNNLLPSILAKIEANHAGADDSLMLDIHGFVAETNATHVFLVKNSVVLTARTTACPEGITRSVVLQLCRKHAITCDERDLTLTDVYRADEMFCSGTMGELVPVIQVDGRKIGCGEAGPMTIRIATLFAELAAGHGVRIL